MQVEMSLVESENNTMASELLRLRAALVAINAIRESIVGSQTVNWSEHVYPLAEALDKAGYQGADYQTAHKNVGTLIERATAAEAKLATAAEDERKRIVEYLRGVSNQFANGDAVAQCDFTADAYGMAADDIEKMHHHALAEIEGKL